MAMHSNFNDLKDKTMDIKTPREYFLDEAIKRHWNILYSSKIGLDFCKEYAEYYHQAKLKLFGIGGVVGRSEHFLKTKR